MKSLLLKLFVLVGILGTLGAGAVTQELAQKKAAQPAAAQTDFTEIYRLAAKSTTCFAGAACSVGAGTCTNDEGNPAYQCICLYKPGNGYIWTNCTAIP